MQTVERILGSRLGRKAVETGLVLRNGRPCAANFLRDLLEEIDKLAQYVQLSEFTEHGLPHLLNLVERVETWTRAHDGSHLLDSLNADEAFLLCFAILSHDLGMLAQSEIDLQEADRLNYARVFADLPTWIRRTHVPRLEGILRRLLTHRYPEFTSGSLFGLGCSLARSHQSWPSESGYDELQDWAGKAGFDPERIKALAGVLAVADLLDEDSGRCESMVLFANKAGNLMNRAHWLRHLLTKDRLRIDHGVVRLQIHIPKNLDGKLNGSLEGVRNHVRLAEAYNLVLAAMRAQIKVEVLPHCVNDDEVPRQPALDLLLFQPDIHLMRTLSDKALPGADGSEGPGTDVMVLGVTLKRIDRTNLDDALGPAGAESGRSDLEITYAVACLEGEEARIRALRLIRNAAFEADARGDIDSVRRLSSLVVQDLLNHDGRPLTGALWALAYKLHWAISRHELLSVERLLEPYSEAGTDRSQKNPPVKLPLIGRVIALTVQALLGWRAFSWTEFSDATSIRLDFFTSPFEADEHIAWHDLFEALWAGNHLMEDATRCLPGFSRLQELERANHSSSQRRLGELAWRIAVQSQCLKGFGRWEAHAGTEERQAYALLPDQGRESLQAMWTAWFGDFRNALKEKARLARRCNPPGSELYVAGVEADRLAARVDLQARLADDDLHREHEFSDATDHDQAYRLVDSTVAAIRTASLSPKKDGEVYVIGSRDGDYPAHAGMLGERLALRRWYLGSWHKVVGCNVQTLLSWAHTMHLEGEEVAKPVLTAVQDLPWGLPYAGNSMELLNVLYPLTEPQLSSTDLMPVWEAIARSPERIGNIRHPGLFLLGDALSPEMLDLLAKWTLRELECESYAHWPETFRVWPDVLKHTRLAPEFWSNLTPLFEHAMLHLAHGDEFLRIVQAAIARAPWDLAGSLLARISTILTDTDNREWVSHAKSAVVDGLLNRRRPDWNGTEEHLNFVAALKQQGSVDNDPHDVTLLEFLRHPAPQHGYEELAERWLAVLERVKNRAVARREAEFSWYGDGYPTGPSRPISQEMSSSAANALQQLWEAEHAHWREIDVGTKAAAMLFEASSESGLAALATVFITVLASRRTAVYGFGDHKSCAGTAWASVANQSDRFPEVTLPELATVLGRRLFELPLEVAWTQARFACEILLRSNERDVQQRAQHVLLAVRGRTTSQSAHSAGALVSSVDRLLAEPIWPPQVEEMVELLVEWTEEVANAPAPWLREKVATVCTALARRLSGPLRERILNVVELLKRDVRMRVRLATEA